MSYVPTGIAIPGHFPGGPGGLPGPISRAAGPVGPTMPASLFPTHTRVGDVVTVTGPFGGMMQGSVRVKFTGTSWLSPQMMGPATASVVVPQGARNGVCEIEVNGRRIYGTNCIIDQGVERVGRPSHKGRDSRAWTQKGSPIGLAGIKDAWDRAPSWRKLVYAGVVAYGGWYLFKTQVRPALRDAKESRRATEWFQKRGEPYFVTEKKRIAARTKQLREDLERERKVEQYKRDMSRRRDMRERAPGYGRRWRKTRIGI
jgi:hypothetical protein